MTQYPLILIVVFFSTILDGKRIIDVIVRCNKDTAAEREGKSERKKEDGERGS